MKAADIEDIFELSPIQQGILFHVLSEPQPGMYVEQGVCRIEGELQYDRFEQAWRAAVARHDALRTAIYWKGLSHPIQVVYRSVDSGIHAEDWRGLAETDSRLRDRLAEWRMLDLSRPPLAKPALIRRTDSEHDLVVTIHHLVHDARSLSILLEEILSHYESQRTSLEASILQYSEYVRWLKTQDLHEAERFWRQETAEIATHRARLLKSSAASFRTDNGFGRVFTSLQDDEAESIQQFCKESKITLSTIFQGAWSLALAQYSRTDRAVFGLVTSGRPPQLAGIDRAVGVFVNTLPFYVRLQEEEPAAVWLRELQSHFGRIANFGTTPLPQIRAWANLPAGVPLFEAIFVFQNQFRGLEGHTQGGLRFRGLQSTGHPNYPLMFRVTPGEKCTLEIVYDHRRISAATAQWFLSVTQKALEEMKNAPNQPLRRVMDKLQAVNVRQVSEEPRRSFGERLRKMAAPGSKTTS